MRDPGWQHGITDGWVLLDEWHIGVLVPAEIGPAEAADLRDEVGLEVVALGQQLSARGITITLER